MKPQTKLHHVVYDLHKKLPDITKKHKNWAYRKLFKYYAWKTKHLASCFECGHTWREETTLASRLFDIKCPKCKKKLTITDTKAWSKTEIDYFKILTVVEDFQVLRMFQIQQYCHKGYKASYHCKEIYQQWLLDDGRLTTVARNVNAMGFNYSGHARWIFHQPMEIKNSSNDRYYINGTICYPDIKIRQIYKRNGFTGEFFRFSEIYFFQTLLVNNKFETLLKAHQFSLMEESANRRGSVDKYWSQIKICMRHRYLVNDAPSWFDHLKLLEEFGYDIHNPKYICPTNFNKEHAELINRRDAIETQKEEAEKKEREYNDLLYRKAKRLIADIMFTDGVITIVPLKNVRDFQREQRELKHCVYKNDYHKKDTSLIMSARLKEERLETIEITLDDYRVRQCRGYDNQDSKYHSEILNLLERSIPKLKVTFEKSKQKVKSKVKKVIYAA